MAGAAHRNRILSVSAVVLWTAGVLLVAVHLRHAPADRAYAWPAGPWDLPPGPVGLLLAIGGLILGASALRSDASGARRASLIRALLWPALPLGVAWLVLPAAGPPTPKSLLLVAAVGAGLTMLRRGSDRPAPRPRRPPWLEPRWIGFHGAALLVLAASVALTDGVEDPPGLWVSLLLYPLYALVQLFLVLVAIAPSWRRWVGEDPRGVAVLAAAVFALVHWPNPLLMVLTGLGMIVWAREYLRGRPPWALAVSMGLLATLSAQGLPHDWTEHMRTGPRAVRQRAAPDLAARAAAQVADRPAGRARTEAWLAELYPGIVGREARAVELDRWWRSIDACRRGMVAWHFFLSSEYRRRQGLPEDEPPFDPGRPWAHLPEPWVGRIHELVHGAPVGAGDPWEAYLEHLYREVLDREAAAEEIQSWSRTLAPRQQQRVVELLLERRHDWSTTPFDTLDCATMGFYN